MSERGEIESDREIDRQRDRGRQRGEMERERDRVRVRKRRAASSFLATSYLRAVLIVILFIGTSPLPLFFPNDKLYLP